MIEIDGKIVSTDLLTEHFCCDITACKGQCCIDGDSGAPLEIEEVDILEQEYENYKPYMTPEGIAAVEEQGFMVVDSDGDYTTPLVNGCECAYTFVNEQGITLCAIEAAYRAGKCSFKKPISCHLYPIRVVKFSNGTVGLNYHRWGICSSACKYGKERGIPVYKSLKEPIERCFGEEFYKALECAEDLLKDSK